MNAINTGHHPVALVSKIANLYGWDLTLSFSRYFYRPQSVLDEREVVEVPIVDVTADWLSAEVATLGEGWELALNSRVKDARGRTRHIGMIDLIGKPDMTLVRQRIAQLLGPKALHRTAFYDSGRSVHVYVLDLIGTGAWHEFLGRLLLMNLPNASPVVDTRWVGHRLLGGYSALRWSANTRHHQSMPIEISSQVLGGAKRESSQ